jgi:polyphosphate:AMP phosphotransferase
MKDGEPNTSLDADQFEAEATALRGALLDAQFDLAERKRSSVLILLNGADGAGKGEVLNRLHEWLDPRTLASLVYDITDHHSRMRPRAWHYWRDMPARGRIGVMIGSWYHTLLLSRAVREVDQAVFMSRIERINRVEDMLEAEGVSLVKLWMMHSDRKTVNPKTKASAPPGSRRNPLVREWVEVDTKKEHRRLVDAARELIAATTDSRSPWHIVGADDPRARDLAVGRIVLQALQTADHQPARPKVKPPVRPRRIAKGPAVLPTLDLSRSLDKSSYEQAVAAAQARIFALTESAAFRDRALVVVFEGNDAAGKGGAIRRLRSALSPIHSRVHPIAAPSDEELAHHYLWRFWRRIPPRGQVGVYDRSWYGRVVVERVEGYAAPGEWKRAYAEINDFEGQLGRAGYIVQKFWMAIDADEQLARFEARKETPHKRFKITDDDWRNREKWPLYAAAVEDMIALTSTPDAPWTLVESNCKRFARVKVLETLAERLEKAL